MITKVCLENGTCIHHPEQWKQKAQKGGIDLTKWYGFYRNSQTGNWVIFQDKENE